MNKPKIEDHERNLMPLESGFDKLLSPFEVFFRSQSVTGIALLFAALLAFFLANSSYRPVYEAISHLQFGVSFDQKEINFSLHHWVNHGLMAVFFFVLGMEIKREVLVGDLRDLRHSSLVVFMALGGMIAPAAIYVLLTVSTEGLRGWGIPMATDTAFALGVLSLLGRRAPRTAAILLSALAIVDDIGAVLVITLFYTENIDLIFLGWALCVFLLLIGLNISGARRPFFYLIGGVLLWWFVLRSGVHATLAGIMVAMVVPTRPYAKTEWFVKRMDQVVKRFRALDRTDKSIFEKQNQHHLVEQAQEIALKTATPLQHWSSVLDRPVSLAIMPLFAFLNAGVELPESTGELIKSPVMWATALGLLLGKVVGISSFAWLCLKFNLASLPKGLNFGHIFGLSLLGGMGFTMSLFIAALAFAGQPQLLAYAKLGILAASLLAAVFGACLFVWLNRRPAVAAA